MISTTGGQLSQKLRGDNRITPSPAISVPEGGSAQPPARPGGGGGRDQRGGHARPHGQDLLRRAVLLRLQELPQEEEWRGV